MDYDPDALIPVYYEHAFVHDRTLVWWDDEDGKPQERWFEGERHSALIDASFHGRGVMQWAIHMEITHAVSFKGLRIPPPSRETLLALGLWP